MELTTAANPPRLRRVLRIWDLVFYGLALIQPIAPVEILGVAEKLSYGHDSTAVLAAMMLTGFSYRRRAAIYPSAGSVYTYVSRGLNRYVASLIGWAMVLDYLVIPICECRLPRPDIQEVIFQDTLRQLGSAGAGSNHLPLGNGEKRWCVVCPSMERP